MSEQQRSKPADFEIKDVDDAMVLPLRHAVLRPGRPLKTACFPQDDAPTTKHFAAFRDGVMIGVASVYEAELPGHPTKRACQLRGMATEPASRGKGVGRALVDVCLAHARKARADFLWCNARTSAAGFYSRLGFEVVGDQFEIPDVGPHFRMMKKLS